MKQDPGKELLKGVSRSFYLSLRLLPAPMRRAASLGYLLARTSDTLADSAAAPVELRLQSLDGYARAIAGGEAPPRWSLVLLNAVADSRERLLLEAVGNLISRLRALPAAEAELVRKVAATIISGQRLDLKRFSAADAGHPVALPNDAALEDYAWRVAGCVGEFWTRLGFLTLGERFSTVAEADLIERGITYGKGLQLVNILRDLPVDLASGRCYLPVADPQDPGILLETHHRWVERALDWVGEGFAYAETLRSRRLRAASVLPAMLARETLGRMRGADWETLEARVKVPRGRVYLAMARAFF